jgi:hypothetical protein
LEEDLLQRRNKEEAVEQLLNSLLFSLLKQRFLSQGVLHPASGMSLSPLVFAAGFRMTGVGVSANLIFRRY